MPTTKHDEEAANYHHLTLFLVVKKEIHDVSFLLCIVSTWIIVPKFIIGFGFSMES
jgi:hypothetical protein